MTFLGYSEPIRLTRASLTGVTFRLGRVYGSSPIGIRVYIAYHASKGCRDSLMGRALSLAVAKGVPDFANVNGRACSLKYYERLTLTGRERERRELNARRERGEKFEMFSRRQA